MIKEIAYAKINLALEVMNKVDQYHMVNNIMIPIELHDIIELEKSEKTYIENDFLKDNICMKAAQLFLEKYKIKSGVKLKIIKKIPIAAGLAGGSSDAASVLKGMNKLFNINASNQELKLLAEELGSDVPFFIDNEPSLCTNRGEKINKLIYNLESIDVILINPNTNISTKEVYANYLYKNINKEHKINNIIDGLKHNDILKIKNNLFNDLEEVALSLDNKLKEIFLDLINQKVNVHVSGSGPTLFVINPEKYEKNAIFSLKNVTIIETKTVMK